MISDEFAHNLELRLQGLKNELHLYSETSYGNPQKGQYFTNLLSYIAESEPYFFDKRNPEKTIPYFSQMGTIALAMHREQVINYKEIYGEDDKDSEKHINDLKEKISTYYKGAEQMFDTAMKWREGFITLDDHKSGLFTKVHTYTYKDAKNPNDDQVLSSNFGESQAKEAFESLKKRTMNQYEAQLNTILMPSSSWKYFDSTQYSVPYEPEKRWKVVESGPFGLGLGGSSFDDKKLYGKHGFPTQIVVRSGSRIDSI